MALTDFVEERWLALERSQAVTRLLERSGIDSRRFWLLRQLFITLRDRGQVLDQAGYDVVGLTVLSGIGAAFVALGSLVAVAAESATLPFLVLCLAATCSFLLPLLLSEAGNSLVNPVEGLVLVHQPIPGATYTAAKLSHLLNIVVVVVGTMNLVPAVLGVFLPGSPWWYPLGHLVVALCSGLVIALCLCSGFGWLLRYVPVRRLRMAALLVGSSGLLMNQLAIRAMSYVVRLDLVSLLPASRSGKAIALGSVITLIGFGVVGGLRALSADYLVMVSELMHGEGGRHRGRRRPSHGLIGDVIARVGGGQAARAGAGFVSIMLRRDWYVRRALLAVGLTLVLSVGSSFVVGLPASPFSAEFSPVHLMLQFFVMCTALLVTMVRRGYDRQGLWLFQTTAAPLFDSLARGIAFSLWGWSVLVPAALFSPLLLVAWGPRETVLFLLYAVALSSVWQTAHLRQLTRIPFSDEPDALVPSGGSTAFSLLKLAALGLIGVAQPFWVFRSPIRVVVVTLILGVASVVLARRSVRPMADGMRAQMHAMSLST